MYLVFSFTCGRTSILFLWHSPPSFIGERHFISYGILLHLSWENVVTRFHLTLCAVLCHDYYSAIVSALERRLHSWSQHNVTHYCSYALGHRFSLCVPSDYLRAQSDNQTFKHQHPNSTLLTACCCLLLLPR